MMLASEPATAANAEPMPKVTARTRRTSIPQACAASGCCEVARMALPNVHRPRQSATGRLLVAAVRQSPVPEAPQCTPVTSADQSAKRKVRITSKNIGSQ